MTLVQLMALATLAAHPHADCAEPDAPCVLQPAPREPVTLVAIPRDLPGRWRAQMQDGFGASAYTFYMQRGESRVPISRADAAQFAADPEVKRRYARYTQWRIGEYGPENGALGEALWQRRLGVSSTAVSWAMLGRDASMYASGAPVRMGMTLYNALAATLLIPDDGALIKAARIEVEPEREASR